MTSVFSVSERVLVLAPYGRDGTVASKLLIEAGYEADICSDWQDLTSKLKVGAGVAIITDDARQGILSSDVGLWVASQAPWSDFPFILLTGKSIALGQTPIAQDLTELLGNVTYVERPFHPATLISTVRTALRARLRQYQARRAAEILRYNEQRLKQLAENLPQLVWTCLADGSCNYLSPQWVAYTGIPVQEQLGYAWLDKVIHPDDRTRIWDHWMGAVQGKHSYDIEYRIRGEDGNYRWFVVRGTSITGRKDQITGWFGTCTDIEDIVKARNVLARGRKELEDLVIARTSDLERSMAEREKIAAALRQSQKMEAIGQLTGGIAHDFNNLLQVVSSGITLLKRTTDPAKITRLTDSMEQASARGAKLTKQLLAFARNQTLLPEEISFAELFTGVKELLTRSLRDDIEIIVDIEANLLPIYADPTQLELAIINIAVNARDAMPRGGRFEIKAFNEYRKNTEEEWVRITFADSGEGMSQDVLTHVFEPFFTTKDVGRGTGLGLSQVYGFLKQSKGDIKINSQPGEGTQVSFWLPRANVTQRKAVTNQEKEASITVTDSIQRRVLLVEDDEDVANLAREMLIELGYTSQHVINARDALEILSNEQIVDLVVSDIMIPGGTSGIELAYITRKLYPSLPIVLATGYQNRDIDTFPIDKFPLLRKPYSLDSLHVAIQNAFKMQKADQHNRHKMASNA